MDILEQADAYIADADDQLQNTTNVPKAAKAATYALVAIAKLLYIIATKED